jgi:hypothetical protein
MGERSFSRLEAAGILTPTRPGKGGRPSLYELEKLVPQYLAHLGQSHPATEDREARARRDRSAAELNELKIAELRGALLRREDVVADGQAFAKALQARLRGLPRRLVQAGLVAREHEQAAAALVREALEEVSRWASLRDLQLELGAS